MVAKKKEKNMSEIKEKFIVDEKGKKTGVILPIKKYYDLLEDLHDLAIVAERKNETYVHFDDIRKIKK